jgi:hypothetical protein
MYKTSAGRRSSVIEALPSGTIWTLSTKRETFTKRLKKNDQHEEKHARTEIARAN